MRFPRKEIVEAVRARYPKGTRVELVFMDDPYSRLKPGDRGTVEFVDDIATVHVKWDEKILEKLNIPKSMLMKFSPTVNYRLHA